MNQSIIYFFILVITYNSIFTNAEKLIVVIPSRQIRRSPTVPLRSNVPQPYLKLSSPYATYGSVRPGTTFNQNNQLPHGFPDFEQTPNSINHVVKPYGKGNNYGVYARGYVPYDKFKGGLVPLINQNRYPSDATRLRYQLGPAYGTGPPTGTYYQRPVDTDSYLNSNNPTTRPQIPVDRPQVTFTNQRPAIGSQDPSVSQNSPQPTPSNNYSTKLGPIIVQPASNSQQVDSKRPTDLSKEGTTVIGKVPPISTVGPGKEIVIRDSLLLDDYEKKIAEFTKGWPKLSAFPDSFESTSSFFPGSSTFGQSPSFGVSRSSDYLDNFPNTIGRQGYAVKEEIDEPPIDFRTMPIITSPLAYAYPTPTTASLYNPTFG